ncbi:MAG TPA: hypothetical protein DCQ98_16410 [Planctomycetaceae bacterium]|nr:hypothetical protein [Planctomycetaceae bacterium]HRF02570.1 hypothetical protein [Pirellulaceae bacterium]
MTRLVHRNGGRRLPVASTGRTPIAVVQIAVVRFAVVLLALLSSLMTADVSAQGPSRGRRDGSVEDPIAWVSSLEERRLFRLAAEALDRFAASQPDSAALRQARLRRLRIEAAWGVETSGAERKTHWETAHRLANEWLATSTDPRDRLLLTVQDALTGLARAETLRDEDQGGAIRDAAVAAEALESIRAARALLDTVEREIPNRMNEAQPPGEPAWDATRWLALQRNVRFHRARADLERAHWYEPAQRLDRLEAYQAAAERLDEVARQVTLDEPLAWQVIAARARALRETEQLEAALDVLVPPPVRASDEAWLGWLDQAPAELRGRLVAERFRLEKAAGAGEAAGRWTVLAIEGRFGRSAELDLAILERLLDRFETTKDSQFQDQAVAWGKRIEAEHGPYWGRRAARMLVGRTAAAGSGNVDLVLSIADERTLQGRLDEAVAGYREARSLAERTGRPDQARLAAIRLGAIAQGRGDSAEAANWFAIAAAEAKDDAETRTFTWYALRNRLTAVEGLEPGTPETLEANRVFDEQLRAFVERWPTSNEASQGRLVLMARWITAGRLAEAIEIGASAGETDPGAERVEGLVDTAIELLLRRERDGATGELRAAIGSAAEALGASLEAAPLAAAPAAHAWRIRQAVRWSRLALRDGRSDPSTIVARLDAIAASAGNAADVQQVIELRLARAAAAGRAGGKVELSGDDLAQLEKLSVPVLLDAAESLAERLEGADGAERAGLGELLRAVAERPLDRLDATPGADRVRRDRCRIAALQGLDLQDQAVERIEALIAEYPNDGALQRWGAERLTAAGAEHRAKAIEQWRRFAARSAPQTDGWFEARYRIAELTAAQGDKERALQLLKYLQSTPPGWDEAPNRAAFERLLRDLQR